MTPAAARAIEAVHQAAQLLATFGRHIEAMRLRAHVRTLEAELNAKPEPAPAPKEPET